MLLISSIQVLFLGSIYTLSRKFQILQVSEGLDGTLRHFHHPMYQTFWLFVGMALCLLFKKCVTEEPSTKKKPFPALMVFPAFCDVCATIFDSIGLINTQVSIHQMLKGFIVLFTGIISYYAFKKRFSGCQIFGAVLTMLGLFLVGSSNLKDYEPTFAPNPILGNFLVLLSQFFLAGMFVYEEKILKEYSVNVFEVVGWEGVWGTLISFLVMCFFYLIPGHDYGSWENPFQATHEVKMNYKILVSISVSALVLAPFNYYGTTLTKYSSAMLRCLIDASRMCVIWAISICCGWENFRLQQAVGYLTVLMGNVIYFQLLEKDPEFSNNFEKLESADLEKKDEGSVEIEKGNSKDECETRKLNSESTSSDSFHSYSDSKQSDSRLDYSEDLDLNESTHLDINNTSMAKEKKEKKEKKVTK